MQEKGGLLEILLTAFAVMGVVLIAAPPGLFGKAHNNSTEINVVNWADMSAKLVQVEFLG